jgi:perosamine synthetase
VSTSFEPGAAPDGFIPLCVPEIRGNAWRYVKQCLDANWVSTAGPFVDRFERQVADSVGAKYAVAVVNGTAALHIALLVSGVRPDDEVLVPALTFIATANAVRYAGAWPVFLDAEPLYAQLDPQKLLDFLGRECVRRDGTLYNRTTRRRVKAILPVHVLGHPVDMDPLLDAARRYDLVVIEDAAEALGARYKGRPAGRMGDVGCFSFNGNKLLTCGGGGVLVTDDARLAERARYLTTQAKDDPLEYVHGAVGYNYRLTNLQAALGCAQMELLDEYVAAKRAAAARYHDAFREIDGIAPLREAPWAFSTFWMYTVRVGGDSRPLLGHLASARIQTRPLWQPLHRSPAHAGCQAYHVEVADHLYREALSLPCSVGLSAEQQAEVVRAISAFLGKGQATTHKAA